jgi:AbrB family looped-hinge helix DNA binding protein
MTSTVTVRGQTAIPASIRRQYNITAHTRLEWIDDGQSITVVPIPPDPISALQGKFKNSRLSQALAEYRAKERQRA